MSSKSGSRISVTAQVEYPEVLEEVPTPDLIAELQRREDQPTDVLHRIWVKVMHYGFSLEDVVSDLMRERTWPWRTGGRS